MVSLFAAQMDLVLQITILVLLIVSLVVMRLKKIKPHALLMLSAVVLNLVSFGAIMAPAFDDIGEGGLGTISTVAILHVTIGGLTILSSFWVLGTWLIPSVLSPKTRCYGKFNKRLMTAVTVLWIAALVAGIVLFLMVYTTVLGNFVVFSGGD